MLNEGDMPYSACVRCATCDGFPCLVHAKSDAEVLAVRPALEHANVTLLTNAEAVRARHQRGGHGGHRGRGRAGGRARDVHRATSSSCPAGRPTRPSCCSPRPATSIRTAWPTAPTRSVATTCSTTARRCWRCPRKRTRRSSRRPSGLNDFYFGSDDFEYPLGNIQMVGKSSGADVPRREADRDQAGARRGRWSRSPATRSTSGSRPRTCRGRTTGSPCDGDGSVRLSYTPTNDEPKKRLLPPAQVDARPPGDAPGPPAPAARLPEERDPGRRLRPPGGHLPLRHRPRHLGARTSTAGPTSSTTSTSSTRASSPASAP